MAMEVAPSTTTSTSHTLSADPTTLPANNLDGPTTPATFLSVLADSPHVFLQPPPRLHVAALELTKRYLDPLAASVSEAQQLRQQQARQRKRKRGEESTGNDQILKLRKLYVDGLDVEQVWGQAQIILEATMEELGRITNLPAEKRESNRTKSSHAGRTQQGRRRLIKQSGASDSEASSQIDSALEEASLDQGEEDPRSSMDGDPSGYENGYVSDGEDRVNGPAEEDAEGLGSGEEHSVQSGGVEDNIEEEDLLEDEVDDPNDAENQEEIEIDDAATSATLVDDPNGLNDGFFSIDDFNKQSQFLERQDATGADFDLGGSDDESIDWHVDPMASLGTSKARPGKEHRSGAKAVDENDDDDDGPTFGNADLHAPEGHSDEEMEDRGMLDVNGDRQDDRTNTNDIRYEDFFAPPSRRVRRTGEVSEKSRRPGQKKTLERTNEDDIQRTMDAVRRDLFEDELSANEVSGDDQEMPLDRADPKSRRSTHERQKAKLADEIRKLELANVAKKEWTLSGEARAADRPINSLLEQDLEFERTGKPVPVITAEVSESIEDMIKRRIIAQEFDELIRRRPDDLFNPSDVRRGRFELDDNKAQQSLAELYEEDHLRQVDPQMYQDKTGEKLRREHEEIEMLWKDLSGKLDALSNWHYKPKPPKPSIHIVADVPTIVMEDARPTATVGGTDLGRNSMLAPQEVYTPGHPGRSPAGEVVIRRTGAPVARQEMSREEKARVRRREKKKTNVKTKEADRRATSTDAKQMPKKEKEKEKKSNNNAEAGVLLHTLERAGVKVIGKKGEVRDVKGRKVVVGSGGGRGGRGVGGYKL